MQTRDNQIRAHYESTAENYSKKEGVVYLLDLYKQEAIQSLTDHQIEQVYDIGCGSGVITHALAQQFPQIRFVGIDFSTSLIEIARQQTPLPNLEFHAGEFSEYEKRIAPSDLERRTLVLLLGPLAHYHVSDEFTQKISQFWKTLRKGTILITMHNADAMGRGIWGRKEKKYWKPAEVQKLFCAKDDPFRIRYFTPLFLVPIYSRFPGLNGLFSSIDAFISRMRWSRMMANFLFVVTKN